MRRALNVLSGQVYGKVDWVTHNKREIGMFIYGTGARTTRCIVTGEDVETLLQNNLLLKGMMVTAHGEFYGRVFHRKENDSYEGELACQASRIVTESAARTNRVCGSVYVTLKGVVMHWDAQYMLLKTFFNYQEDGRPEQVTCSLALGPYCKSMPEAVRGKFLSSIRAGREFTASCLVDATTYVNRDQKAVPVMQMLPLDFKLQH